MYDFKAIARNELVISPLMEGREKISTEEIIKEYGGVLTITEFDIVDIDKGRYPVFHFAESSKHFYAGGYILAKIFDKYLADFSGEISAVNSALASAGGLKVKLGLSRTRTNNNITTVDLL